MAILGFPDATNTGVPAGVTLTPYYGNLVINTPGAVIEGLDIQGNVTIAADNVTLKDCKVTSSAFSVVSISSGVTGVVIQDCEINGLGETSNSRGIGGQGTFLRNNIYNVENGINIQGSNTLIQGNYIHDLNVSSLAYGYDGIQILGGVSNVTVSDNTIINPHSGTAVRIVNDYGAVDSVVVDNNMLSGGDFAVLSDEKSSYSGQITGVQFTNNYLDKVSDYAFVANNSVVWQGNIDLDTGWAVSQDGTLTQNSQPAEITVLGNGASITDGDTSPSNTDFTDFGSATQGGAAVVRTFTVRNDGGSTLTLGTPTLPAGFSLMAGDPLVSSLAPGASDTFQVQMSTTSTGTKSGQISISNNDSNESPFNFSITGTVNAAATPAEITVLGNGASITDGDTSPSNTDFTNFGSATQDGAAVVRTFTVRNDGGSTLTLGTPTLPAGFSLMAGDPLVSSLAPGASDTFQVQMGTTSTGTKSGQISISNNDSNESPFNFSITGTVYSTGGGTPTTSLFSASNTPAGINNNDGTPLEVGMKFQSSVAGQITALKFYRSPSDTGSDLLDLWAATGTKLASATFTNTAASGWQTVALSTPVAIAANTTYLVSYHTTGAYVATDNFFTTDFTSGMLTAPHSRRRWRLRLWWNHHRHLPDQYLAGHQLLGRCGLRAADRRAIAAARLQHQPRSRFWVTG